MANKRKKVKSKSKRKFVPKNVYDQADQDYKDKLSPADKKVWVDQFNAEYYSNDHSHEGSLFRTRLKGYDTKIVDVNDKGKGITMKQKLFGMTNARNRCMLNDAIGKKEIVSFEDWQASNPPEQEQEEYEMSLSEKLDEELNYLSPKQILNELKKEAREDIKSDPTCIEKTLEWYSQAVMVLALKATKRASEDKTKTKP